MYVPKRGWRQIVERMVARLDAATAAQPAEDRHQYRVLEIREKFGLLTVHLASVGTPEMQTVIQEAKEAAKNTCDVCGAPGVLGEWGPVPWMSVRCNAHENWTRLSEMEPLS